MLKITDIQVGHTIDNCITDTRPNIRFALESNVEGEALDYAIIRCGDWSIRTTDQLNNVYDGSWSPFTTYDLRIEAFGTSGEQAVANASFITGRLDTPWKGQWITDGLYSFPEKESPVPMVFRKEFALGKTVKKAWINATALGIYVMELNGQRVGEDYFAPGLTSYEHQIQYQTYDVTKLLQNRNEIMVTVAGGWAAGAFTYGRKSHISCDRQAFLGEVHVLYDDGSSDVYATDTSWQVTEQGPVKMAEWYDGETYDATCNWNQVIWRTATITAPRNNPKLIAQYGEPVRAQESMEPVSCSQAPSGEYIYDFGQNFAGVIAIHVKNAKAGQVLTFRHAEVLMDGELFVKSLRTAKATATYTCKDGEQTYSPQFTYMGFRYVGMTGIQPEDIEVRAYVLHSNIASIGTFECSNPLINQLHHNIIWGGKSNFVDIPTDCPQRDEREGWTGDTAVFASTACFNFDMSRFYDKWLLDVSAEQGPHGGIPMVVPKQGDAWPAMATSCWGDCCILVPWAEYLARGDQELLKRQYPTMKKFLGAAKKWSHFLSVTPSRRYVWSFPFHFGDWCAPDGTAKDWVLRGKWVGTAYFANSCSIVVRIARILGYEEDAKYYEKLRNKIIKAYRKVFTDGQGKLKKEFQTAYVLPLFFDMTDGEETKAMAANLARMIRDNGNKLATGFPSTPYLLFALSDYGYLDLAYDVLLQEDCPGWLYEVKSGGTTIWERWDALRPDGTVNIGSLTDTDVKEAEDGGMVSFNHYANGAVGDWLYRRMAGIEPISGGYRTFRVAPKLGGGITYAKAGIRTPYGHAKVVWELKDERFEIQVEVPVSTSCMLELPDGTVKDLSSGKHHYSCEYKNSNGLESSL